MLLFFINLLVSLRRGALATGNVWESRSPEWQFPSPAPMHNYPMPMRVVGEPYDYGLDEPYIEFGEKSAEGEGKKLPPPNLVPEAGD